MYAKHQPTKERDKCALKIQSGFQGNWILYSILCLLFHSFDDRKNFKPGWKFSEYELKGVPIRLALGPKDIQNNSIEIARRDTLEKEIIKEKLKKDI